MKKQILCLPLTLLLSYNCGAMEASEQKGSMILKSAAQEQMQDSHKSFNIDAFQSQANNVTELITNGSCLVNRYSIPPHDDKALFDLATLNETLITATDQLYSDFLSRDETALSKYRNAPCFARLFGQARVAKQLLRQLDDEDLPETLAARKQPGSSLLEFLFNIHGLVNILEKQYQQES